MKKFHIPYFWLLAAPTALFAFGALLNILVTSANHGMMPVVVPTSQLQEMIQAGWTSGSLMDEAHKVMEHGDHLKFLSDWIHIPGLGTASIGDGFLELSDWVQNYVYGAWIALVARDYCVKE